jgi:hypothetical protein
MVTIAVAFVSGAKLDQHAQEQFVLLYEDLLVLSVGHVATLSALLQLPYHATVPRDNNWGLLLGPLVLWNLTLGLPVYYTGTCYTGPAMQPTLLLRADCIERSVLGDATYEPLGRQLL